MWHLKLAGHNTPLRRGLKAAGRSSPGGPAVCPDIEPSQTNTHPPSSHLEFIPSPHVSKKLCVQSDKLKAFWNQKMPETGLWPKAHTLRQFQAFIESG